MEQCKSINISNQLIFIITSIECKEETCTKLCIKEEIGDDSKKLGGNNPIN